MADDVADSDTDEMDDLTHEEKQNVREGMALTGWQTVTVAELLDLTPGEMGLIEVRRALASALRARRHEAGLSQSGLASKMGSSQSRVAFIEQNSGTVSLDLMVRAFFATGATQADLARALTV